MYKFFLISVIFLISCQQKTKPLGPVDTFEDTISRMDTQTPPPPPPTESLSKTHSAAQAIVAGQKIGMIHILEKGAYVSNQLGPADFGDAAMQKSISGWYSKTDSSIQTKIYFENDMSEANTGPHVVQIRVNSPFFLTENGITTGSSLKDIKNYYPDLHPSLTFKTHNTNENITVMDDNNSGIAFEIDTKGICRGITVHVPRHDLFGYLQFYQ